MKSDNFLITLRFIIKSLNKIPEVSKTINIINTNRGISADFADSPINYVKVIFFDYLSIIRTLTNLSNDDLVLMKQINKRRKEIGLDTNPLGHHGIDVFYSRVNKKERDYYWQTFVANLDVGSPIFKSAVSDLSERMMLASKLVMDGVTLKDGGPRADKVIWGHTKRLKPEATIHFVICHFIDRLTSQILQKSKNEKLKKMVLNKHYLFDPFGDMVFLLTTKRMINSEISKRWGLNQKNGGLNWNTSEEQKVFDEEYGKQVKK